MKSDGLGPSASGGIRARLRAMPDLLYGSLRHFLRQLIPFEHRRRVVRFIRRRIGAIWGDSTSSRQASLKALETVLDQTSPQTFDIICFPIIDWDFRFQRPQQLMSQFASAGHRVFYVNQNFRERGAPYQIAVKRPNLYEVSLLGPDRNVYADTLSERDVEQLLTSLDHLRVDLSLAATTMVVQLPFWRPLVKDARTKFGWPIVYDCMDYHAGFSTNRPEMLDEEKDLIASADCVLVSSHFLQREVERDARRTLLLPNGCDYEHFAGARARPVGKTPVIGYYGAIAHWFDTDIVADLAEMHAEWKFLLIGSTFSANLSRLGKLANVSLQGEQPYSALPEWLSEMDVLILPFVRAPLTEATNPVKAYEILATGKPLVSVPIAEMVALTPLVRLASSVSEFSQQISEALKENDAGAVETRMAFARDNTWMRRFEVLEPVLRESFPLASVIVVTYNNLDLNRVCLQSIFTHTDWPQLEVIVVDNASSDGTRQYLQEAQVRYPRLRIILNQENLGFAAANNQGLREAKGQYLVLLNNDTAVPRGWLSALIGHLESDRSIGLIGPVTNEIGNEAKVPVEYTSLAQMPAWAARFMRQHDGETFTIPVLAMFCVALRREVFDEIGFLDERFGVGMFEDDDYARRIVAAGYQVRCARDSFVHHAGSASFKKLPSEDYYKLFDRNRALYEEKWGELWQPHEDEAAKRLKPELRTRLREIVDQKIPTGARDVVFLAGEEWPATSTNESAELARELSERGCRVFFDCSISQREQFFGFKRLSPTLFLYRGPGGVLDELERPIIVARAYHAQALGRWREPDVVYHCRTIDSVRFGEGHTRLLEKARIIIGDASQAGEFTSLSRDRFVAYDGRAIADVVASILKRLTSDAQDLREIRR